MNKKASRVFGLNLTQQLIGIILLFATIFLSFLFVYLDRNINNFVRVEMESVLNRNQEVVVDTYRREHSGLFLESSKEDFAGHKIWGLNEQYQTESYRYLSPYIRNQINLQRQQMISIKKNNSTFEIQEYEDTYLVSIVIDPIEDYTVVSVLGSSYRNAFKSRLISSILNAIFFIVLILFSLMFGWVTSIIRSLNKIQDYVNKVADGESPTLELERQDEIGQVANALVYMNDELSRQEKVKEEIIQNISHDLKTPIATIKSYAESIKDGIYPYDTLEKSVDVIIEHADRLEQKVHSILLLNRMEYVVSNSEDSTVDLFDVVNKTLLTLLTMDSNIEIITELEPTVVSGDEESWRVVCENIIDNALRYATSYIKITLNEHGLTFANDGKQLTNEVLHTMFKPYEKGTDGGFGMGLSIVNKVVVAYGYSVYAENTEDGVIIRIDI